MKTIDIRDRIIKQLTGKRDDFWHQFDREKETLRITRTDNNKGVTLNIADLKRKYSNTDHLVQEMVYYINETLSRMKDETIDLNSTTIYPIVRSSSFYKETQTKHPFIFDVHTNETNIYYAIDFEDSYRIIDADILSKLGIETENLKLIAMQNVVNLPIEISNTETIQGNDFYFINHNDGYDASRILNTEFLNDFHGKIEGEMLVGLPHQDVLIIVDVKNEIGYDIMAQLMMQYFAEGITPITSLTFSYNDQRLQPVFILGKQRDYRKKR